jgi:hypothetical protein
MSEARKVHNAENPSLDLQLTELVHAVTSRAGKRIVALDPDTGKRYEMSVTIVAGEPATKWTLIE